MKNYQNAGQIAVSNYNEQKVAHLGDRTSTEIENRITQAGNAACRLHLRIETLFDRLTPVILQVGEVTVSAGNSNGVPEAPMSPLGNEIRVIEQQIDKACDRIESLLRDLSL